MKTKYTLYVLMMLVTFTSFSQVTTVLGGSNVDEPDRLLLIGNELYFSEDERVSKINVTDNNPTRVTVVDGFDRAVGMALKGNDLYIADLFNSRIVKIDITDSSPSIVSIPHISGKPNMLLFNNDDLYFTDNQADKVSVYDTSMTNAYPQTIASNFISNGGPIGIELKDGSLYITVTDIGGTGLLYKIDIDNPVPIELLSGLQRPLGIEFRGNDLYIAQRDSDIIVKVDITQDPLVVEDVVAVNNPLDITFYNDIMYIATSSKISKVDLNSLDVEEFNNANRIKLSPNPAKEYITISNLKENKAYKLFDINGRVLKSGKLEVSNNSINTSDLTNGTYFVQIDRHNFRFIKI